MIDISRRIEKKRSREKENGNEGEPCKAVWQAKHFTICVLGLLFNICVQCIRHRASVTGWSGACGVRAY